MWLPTPIYHVLKPELVVSHGDTLHRCLSAIYHNYNDNMALTLVPWASCQIRKIAGAHATGMPGTFSSPSRVSNHDMHHDTCVAHVSRCMPGSLIRGFHWIRRWGKRSRHSRRMHHPQFYVSDKRPMLLALCEGNPLIIFFSNEELCCLLFSEP